MPARFKTTEVVDFIVVGAGAAGGVMAKELATAGFSVVVLEQGPYHRAADFKHDELDVLYRERLTNNHQKRPNTFRKTAADKAVVKPVVEYGSMVGGGSVHFTGNYWRFHELDFNERSRFGEVPGTGFADWPITYNDLEPYYTKAEYDLGISGLGGAIPLRARVPSRIRCRRCPSSPPACCLNAAQRSSACIRILLPSPCCPNRIADAEHASTADSAKRSAAKSTRNRARLRV